MKLVSTTKDAQWQEYTIPDSVPNNSKYTLETTGEVCQSMDGFGGCFNELSWVALDKISEDKRNFILNELFGEEGCNFNFCRMPIGASDYAVNWYSHAEKDNDYAMQYFSIKRDYEHLIPYIKAAKSINHDMQIFASPWSPPVWMKNPPAYNFGTLIQDDKTLNAYALYFLKFIKAYEKENISIDQIHVQNEPMSSQKFPSCVWTGPEFANFIGNYLGPLFEEKDISTKIWLGTLNGRETDERALYTGYDDYANLVLSDKKAYKYIEGVSYQWAGKNTIQRTSESWPEKKLIQSENECGDGTNTWEYARYVFDLFRHYLANGVSAYLYWNMVLEPGGSSTWGWNQNSMIIVNTHDNTFTLNPEFYVMKHFSHFVKKGAVRLRTKGCLTGNSIVFKNPNGEIIIVIQNGLNETRELNFSHEDKKLNISLSPNSINTIVI